MKIIRKLLTLALMIVAPIISGRAFYEYGQVAFFKSKPSYPFGEFWMDQLRFDGLSYLASYQSQMLSIAVIFLAISVIAYLSMMFRALVNMVWLALLLTLGFLVYKLF